MSTSEEEAWAPKVESVIANRYKILADLGQCATRRIYRAYDREVEVEVTLWWVVDALFAEDLDRDLFVDSLREVRKIKHPHVLKIFDFGHSQEGKGTYIVLQLGSSHSFEELLQSGGAIDGEVLLRYAQAIAAGIEAAYEQGHYHSWLSPVDVVEVSGQIKVAGIGVFGCVDSERVLRRFDDVDCYTAPEILAGRDGSPASDWYSLSSILLDLATGKKQSFSDGRPEDFDSEKWNALTAALAEDPNERPTTAAQFLLPIERAFDAGMVNAAKPATPPEKGETKDEVGSEDNESETTLDDYIGGRNLLEDDDGNPMAAAEVDSADDPFVSEVVESTFTPVPALPMPGDNEELSASLYGDEDEDDTLISETIALRESQAPASQPPERQSPSADDPELFSGFQERSGGRSKYIPLALAAVVAAGAAYLLSLSGSNSDDSVEPEVALDAAVLPMDAALLGTSKSPCPENMVHVPEQSLCIDAYEFPGHEQKPTVEVSLSEARDSCRQRDARLCLATEWEAACRNKGTQSFSYGNRYRPEICNSESKVIASAGTNPECHDEVLLGEAAIFDMNGNVAEWVEEGQIRGGSTFDGSASRCSSSRTKSDPDEQFPDVGFRCCADPAL